MKATIAVLALTLLFATEFCQALDKMRAPDSLKTTDSQNPVYQTSTVKLVLTGWIRFYSVFISPVDGPRSPSYPTGSAYGMEAINNYGFFPGIFLISERLLHESDRNLGPTLTLYGTKRYFDPLAYNTYWWDHSQLKKQP
jgi:hypothetical protein